MRAGRGFAAFGAAWLIGWTSSEVGPQGPQTEPFQKEGYRKKGQIASASASLFLSPWAESVKGLWKERSASLIRAARMHHPSQATIAAPGAARSMQQVVGTACGRSKLRQHYGKFTEAVALKALGRFPEQAKAYFDADSIDKLRKASLRNGFRPPFRPPKQACFRGICPLKTSVA